MKHCLLILAFTAASALSADAEPPKRNVLIFVTDGLRPGSVTEKSAPTLWWARTNGVNFVNSHSLYPTLTMPNASAIAAGHCLCCTGVVGNYLFTGFQTGKQQSVAPFLEDDQVLSDIDEHFGGNLLNEDALLAFARDNGFSTAAIGKLGPALLQDVAQGNRPNGHFPPPHSKTIVIDDRTGYEDGVPLSKEIEDAIKSAGLPAQAVKRGANGDFGSNTIPGTLSANVDQQRYFVDVLTRVVLPRFKAEKNKGFVIVYWSRDPDGSQHNQGDSLLYLVPGINGPTSVAAVANVDSNLADILKALRESGEYDHTDVFVTADHGFSTISKRDLDGSGKNFTASYAATLKYKDVSAGFLPPGFLAIDLAHELNLQLFDPETRLPTGAAYQAIDCQLPAQAEAIHTKSGHGLLGDSAGTVDGNHPKIVVMANGGSDLIYVPSHDVNVVKDVVKALAKFDYVSGVFTSKVYEKIDGALPLTAVNLEENLPADILIKRQLSGTRMPAPSIVVNFRTFATDPQNPLNTQVQFADTRLQQGQGMHGSFGRGDTFNNMAAFGPHFKAGFVDSAPVSNADVAVTLAHILELKIPSKSEKIGRVINEALKDGPAPPASKAGVLTSDPSGAQSTYVKIQDFEQDGRTFRYFDSAGFAGRTVDAPAAASSEASDLVVPPDILKKADAP